MCLDGLRKEAMSIPLNMSSLQGWKSKARIKSFTSTRCETEHNTQPLWHAVTNFIWEHNTRFITVLASLSVKSVIKETDPTVEYSRKKGALFLVHFGEPLWFYTHLQSASSCKHCRKN